MSSARWNETFDVLTIDDDGQLPVEKLGEAVRCAGGYPTESDVQRMVASNSGDFVSKAAFLKHMETSYPPLADDVAESFRVFDKDGNGTINKVELVHILSSMGDKMILEEAEDFVREADCDKDGNIDFVRFLESVMED